MDGDNSRKVGRPRSNVRMDKVVCKLPYEVKKKFRENCKEDEVDMAVVLRRFIEGYNKRDFGFLLGCVTQMMGSFKGMTRWEAEDAIRKLHVDKLDRSEKIS